MKKFACGSLISSNTGKINPKYITPNPSLQFSKILFSNNAFQNTPRIIFKNCVTFDIATARNILTRNDSLATVIYAWFMIFVLWFSTGSSCLFVFLDCRALVETVKFEICIQ